MNPEAKMIGISECGSKRVGFGRIRITRFDTAAAAPTPKEIDDDSQGRAISERMDNF